MATKYGCELEEGDDIASLSCIKIVPRPLQRVPYELMFIEGKEAKLWWIYKSNVVKASGIHRGKQIHHDIIHRKCLKKHDELNNVLVECRLKVVS